MTRSSPQNIIKACNVQHLEKEWELFGITGEPIENPPLVIGDTGYTQNNHAQISSFSIYTGDIKWSYSPEIPENSPIDMSAHGMGYYSGILYAPTGTRGTVIALNATTGDLIWESERLNNQTSFSIGAIPIIWEDYVIIGASLGDTPPINNPQVGAIRALNRTDGTLIWTTELAVGNWITDRRFRGTNGGAASWSGGALDPDSGIIYVPAGNAAPDFNSSSRPGEQLYANHVVALDVFNGSIIWATPFLAKGTVLRTNATIPDVHDWDVAWGTIIREVDFGAGPEKIVIGHDKFGDIMALNATNGDPIWWKTLGFHYREWASPQINGSGIVWPGTQNGIEAYAAADEENVYVAISGGAYEYFVNGTEGYLVPRFDFPGMENGIGNGSVIALNLKTGDIVWEHDTPTPTWVSPLVTGDVVFSGYITPPGTPYNSSTFGAPIGETPEVVRGIIMALDKNTGESLWEYDVGVPVGIGGPSLANEYLLVPTGSEDEISSNTFGKIVAFSVPHRLRDCNRASRNNAGSFAQE